MKEFVKMVCAVICGLIVMSFLGFFFFAGCVGSMALAGSGSEPVLPRSGILKMDMSTFALSEQGNQNFDPTSLLMGGGTMATPLGLWNAVQAINAAAADPAVKLIYLKPDGATAGMSQMEELRQALLNFRQSGKPVIAWTEMPSTGSYYLASAADKVYMSANAGASPMITGVGTQMIFLGDLLKELGVNVQLIRHGKYKSAGEMYIKGEPSPENLEQNQVMINSIWNAFAADIEKSRDLPAGKLSELVDNLSLVNAQDMVDNGLVDELMTRSQLQDKLATLAVVENFDKVKMIPFTDYVTAKAKPNTKAKKKIAILYAEGNIVEGNSKQQVAGDYFAAQIYLGNADWDEIAAAKAAVRIPVVGNGDIVDGPSALRMLEETGCDGLMIGRGALGRPWIFSEVRAALKGEPFTPPNGQELNERIMRHGELELLAKGDHGMVELRKHLPLYFTGRRGASALKKALSQVKTMAELRDLLLDRDGTDTYNSMN